MVALYGGFCAILLATLVVILTPIFKSKDFTLRQRYLMAGSVFVFFFTLMFAVYYVVGAPEMIALTSARDDQMAQLTQNIVKNSEAVKADPTNAEAWLALGQSFMLTGQYKGAVNAYKEAVKLTGGNAKAILAYATALVSEAGGNITDDAKKSLEMVLLQEPKNPDARYLMAVRDLQDGKLDEAMKTMRELYYSLPDGSPLKEMIDRQIGNKK